MDTYFLCDYCSDYICDGDDYLACECGAKWCSTRCAHYDGYISRKKSSTCDNCCDDSPGSINNYLYHLRYFIVDLVKDAKNES